MLYHIPEEETAQLRRCENLRNDIILSSSLPLQTTYVLLRNTVPCQVRLQTVLSVIQGSDTGQNRLRIWVHISYYHKKLQKRTVLIGTDFHSLPHYTFCYTGRIRAGSRHQRSKHVPWGSAFPGGYILYLFFKHKSIKILYFFYLGWQKKQSRCWVEQFCITSKKNTIMAIVISGLEQ